MRKKKSAVGKIVLIAAVLAIVAGAVFGLRLLNDRKGKPGGEEIVFTVEKGTPPQTIATQLEKAGVIKSALGFRLYLKQTGEGPSLQYGTFTLQKGQSYADIVTALQAVNTEGIKTVTVTFPEGCTLIQAAKACEKAGLCTEEAFIEATEKGDFSDFAFFSRVVDSDVKFLRLEGYIFPDTYEFYADASVEDVLGKIFANLDAKLTPDMYARMKELGYTLEQTLTLASIIQEEAGDPANMNDVSAVLTNRLAPDSPHKALECDVSIRYIYDFIEPYFGGAANVPAAMDKAYDLYNCIGLCAGPISNPGLDAINAALHPEKSQYYEKGYYFFVTDEAGKYYYAKTFSEHQANIAETKKVNAALGK